MAAPGKKTKNEPSTKKISKKDRSNNGGLKNDPNAVHDIYNENNIGSAYDKTIGDDIAFDKDDE